MGSIPIVSTVGVMRRRVRRTTLPMVVLASLLAASCGDEPRFADANSADAARACLPLIRADSGDDGVSLPDGNRASLDGGVVTAPFLVHGELVVYRCDYTFDIATQRYTVSNATNATRATSA